MPTLESQAEALKAAILRDPHNAAVLNELGNTLLQLGRRAEAIAAYDRVIAIDPKFAGAHYNQGLVLLDLGQPAAAVDAFDRAIALQPGHARAHSIRGHALFDLGRFDEAVQSHVRALQYQPASADAHNALGNALLQLEDHGAALRSYDAALALEPGYADAHNNRGNAQYQLGQIQSALASYETSLALQPDYAGVHFNRGQILAELGRYSEAIESFDRAIELKADLPYAWGERLLARMHICDWGGHENQAAELALRAARGEPAATPFCMLALCESAALQRTVAQHWILRNAPPVAAAPAIRRRAADGKIRIGYFSVDFRDHPVARLSAEMYELHDRSRFEVIAFSLGHDGQDGMRARLQQAFDRFIDVQYESATSVAALSRDLRVDIAVDLTGLTKHCRPRIFAARAAPVQVSYLGFLGTMGASYMDYLFADLTLVPANLRAHYAERIAYLPCYQPNDSKRRAAQRTFTREELGIGAGSFVFCCFNANYKITPRMFAVWMRILKRVPHAVMVICAESALAAGNLRKEAATHGVAAERLILVGRLPTDEYLGRYRIADLFLDTAPYNAGTTASDALWAGLPVLTCLGETFCGRMAASLLQAIGLPELITSSMAQYEELAVMLATQPRRMSAIKQALAENPGSTPLFDSRRHVAAIETAFVRMHECRAANRPPADIIV